jgi:hypothetical protein
MRKLLLIVALTFFPASAFAGTPTEAVAFFYAPVQYLPDIELRDRFTDPAKGVFELNDKAVANDQEVSCFDFSPAVDAQDYDEAELAKTLQLTESVSADMATVTAKFTLFASAPVGEGQQEMLWSLRQVDGAWLVSDLESITGKWRLSDIKCELSN